MTRVQPSFWKSIDNHNRSNEGRIGRTDQQKNPEMSQLNLPILICVCVLICVIWKLVNFE